MANNIMAAASALPSILVAGRVANFETTQYTVPAVTAMKIASATVANTTGAAVTIAISLVKTGDAAGDANRAVAPFSLAAGDSAVLNELVGAFLGPGDSISAIAGASNAISLVVTGVVFT